MQPYGAQHQALAVIHGDGPGATGTNDIRRALDSLDQLG
jgi:hypothetical protein